jgi:hypothetical protein
VIAERHRVHADVRTSKTKAAGAMTAALKMPFKIVQSLRAAGESRVRTKRSRMPWDGRCSQAVNDKRPPDGLYTEIGGGSFFSP